MSEEETREKKQVLQIYAALILALVASVLPYIPAAVAALFLWVGVLIAAYVVRRDKDKGGFIETHMTFVIRTIWIGSFIALLVMIAGSAYILANINNTPLDFCVERFIAMGSSFDRYMLEAVFRPCYAPYIQANMKTFIISGAIVAVPTLGYFIYRIVRGFGFALKSFRVSDPQRWF